MLIGDRVWSRRDRGLGAGHSRAQLPSRPDMSLGMSQRLAALALSAMVAACAEGQSIEGYDAAPASTVAAALKSSEAARPGRGGPPPTPQHAAESQVADPVAPLPPTAATDRLVVSTVGDDQPPLLLIDLSRRRVVPLGTPGLVHPDAAFSGTMLAYTIDNRTLGVSTSTTPNRSPMCRCPTACQA